MTKEEILKEMANVSDLSFQAMCEGDHSKNEDLNKEWDRLQSLFDSLS